MAASLLHSAAPLERLLRPRHVAVIGDAPEAGSPMRRLLDALLAGGFGGPVLPVCEGAASEEISAIGGVLAYPSIASLPLAPDLALVSLPPRPAAAALGSLAARGAGGAIVTGEMPSEVPAGFRMIGARSFGVIVPGRGLNASLFPAMPEKGELALVCHDGGVASAVLDHAAAAGIGFSHVVSLGLNDGLGFAATLDWLSRDGATRVVLIEVGRIKDRRGFLSAARACARGRAIVALRSSADQGGAAGGTAPAAAGEVFAAALRRAGVVDVAGLDALLDAATTLVRQRRMAGERVLVVASAPSLGTLAARAVGEAGASLAHLPAEAAVSLGALLGGHAASNPAVLPDFSPANRLGELAACAAGPAPLADAVLVAHAPGPGGAMADLAAEAVAAANAAAAGLPLIAAWPGGRAAAAGRERLATAGVPSYATIEGAAGAIGVLIREKRTREAASELPPSTVLGTAPDRETVRRLLERARGAGRLSLTEDEAGAVLNAYGIPTAPARVAADPESAAEAAAALGFPCVLKLRSSSLLHKTELGGVVLDLETPAAVRAAAVAMAARLARLAPGARAEGFLVQRQVPRAGAQELMLTLGRDGLFGPAISFGQGGTAASIAADVAVDLPPLNRALARALVARTRVAGLLGGYRNHPAVDIEAVYETLVRLSQLAVDFPDIAEVDVNPLVAGPDGVMALDAWIAFDQAPAGGTGHLAIAPYPAERITRLRLADGREVTLRPIRPEDADAHARFFAKLTPEDIRFRFFGPVSTLSPAEIARLTQIDYDREMALIASIDDAGPGAAETLGVVRIIRLGDGGVGEFAIVVRDDAKGHGLGRRLMLAAFDWARAGGITRVVGDVLAENTPMLGFVRRLGFSLERSAEAAEVMVASLDLAPHGDAGPGGSQGRSPTR